MLFFLRKELYVGNNSEKSGDIRRILEANGIKYSFKVVNSNTSAFGGGTRGHIGSINENTSKMNIHYIYVYKKDYDCAIGLVNRLKF
ncbi:MAG: hypothetical protein RR840_02740 [Clostridium sp.]